MAMLLRVPTVVLSACAAVSFGAATMPARPAVAAPRRPAISSVFVSLKNCKKTEGPKTGAGGDFSTLRCGRPVSGWQVQVDYDDSRESITLIRSGSEHPLNLWSVVSSGFSNLGPRFEFRLRAGKAVAGIVRFEHVTNLGDNSSVSKLVVVKLEPAPCVAGIVSPGPTQNAEARSLADRIDVLSCVVQ